MRKLLLLLPLMLLAATGHAELYKWTDENGHVQFSDTKPANNSKVEKINTPSAPPASGSSRNPEKPGSSASMLERQKRISDVLKAEREQREAEAQRIAAEKAEKKQRCHEMVDYQKNAEGTRLYDLDDKGQRKYMDDKEIEKHLADLQRGINEACQP